MGKKGGSAPKSPDPYQTAKAEAEFNRIDTYAPDGSGVRYGYTDGSGNFIQGVKPDGSNAAQSYFESPTETAIREALQPASVDLVNRIIGDNISGMPDAARVKDFNAVSDELYNNAYNRMRPSFEQENDRMLANLQARGIPIGSEAFNETYQQQQRNVNDALTDLAAKSTAAAGAEQSRQFSVDASQRANAISELVAAMGGNYNPSTATPSGNAAGVNYSGLVSQKYQNDMAAYNQAQQQQQSTMGTIGSLGAAALMKSDRRVKTDAVKIGRCGALDVYAYRYIWDRPGVMRKGVMAQDVKKVMPEAVVKDGPWLAVDYSKLPEAAYA